MNIMLTFLSAIAILVWGAKNVQKGVIRAFGSTLRSTLSKFMSNKYKAFLGGALITTLTQSSNATVMMANSFAAQNLLTLEGALAIALGADAGSAIMAKVLTLDLKWLGPVFLITGVWLIIKKEKSKSADIGLALTGLGLMLLALSLIVQTAEPILSNPLAIQLLEAMTEDQGLNIILGICIALLSYSSLAAALLTATLASTGAISLDSALEIAIGGTIGSGILGMMNGNGLGHVSKQSAVGSFIFKVIGAAIFIPMTSLIAKEAKAIGMSPLETIINFHLGWNLIRTIVELFFVKIMAKIMRKAIPDVAKEDDPGLPKYLDQNSLQSPSLALTNAARETVRMSDFVSDMLKGIPLLLDEKANTQHVKELRSTDEFVDRLYASISKYLISLSGIEGQDSKRWATIMKWSMSVEQVGDIINIIINKIKNEKIEKRLSFSVEGKKELINICEEIIQSMNMATALFIEPNAKTAKKLIKQKDAVRDMEDRYTQNHLSRISAKSSRSLETSSLHMDLLSEFKRLHSLICSIAFENNLDLEETNVFSKNDVEQIKTEKSKQDSEIKESNVNIDEKDAENKTVENAEDKA